MRKSPRLTSLQYFRDNEVKKYLYNIILYMNPGRGRQEHRSCRPLIIFVGKSLSKKKHSCNDLE